MMTVDTLEEYKQQFVASQNALFSGQNSALRTIRQNAVDAMLAIKFPTRKTEDWKYTLVPELKKHCFPPRTVRSTTESLKSSSSILMVDRYEIVIHNGVVDLPRSKLPSSILVHTLEEYLHTHPELLNTITEQANAQHIFSLLNTAFCQDGVCIFIPENICVDKPIHIIYSTTEDSVSYFTKNFIFLGENSNVKIIEEYLSDTMDAYFNHVMMRCEIAKGASLSHCKIIQEGQQAQHIAHNQIILNEKADYKSDLISLSGSMIRSDLDVSLKGVYAQCTLNGLVLGSAEQHVDTHTRIAHDVPHCQSRQLYKGIYSENSTGVFNGKVYVAPDAQHTDSSQMNKNLLLSPSAQVNTKPELEIYADDVKCAHGATIGQLDASALFFLRSRGISQAEATILLIHAFAKDVVDNLCIPEISTSLQKVIDLKLSTS